MPGKDIKRQGNRQVPQIANGTAWFALYAIKVHRPAGYVAQKAIENNCPQGRWVIANGREY